MSRSQSLFSLVVLPTKQGEIMLQIDSELKSLIPNLATDEYNLLEESILAEGCRVAIDVWIDPDSKPSDCGNCHNNKLGYDLELGAIGWVWICKSCGHGHKAPEVIIDGHNRYEICTKHDLPYETKEIEFDSKDDAKIWIIKNQLGRRNLVPLVRINLVRHLEPLIAKKAKENQVIRKGDQTGSTPQNSVELVEPIETRQEMAKLANVSHDTYTKGKQILEKATEEITNNIFNGELTINKAYNYLKREEIKEQAKTIEQPKGKYRIIYADPPWQYADKRDGNTTGAEDHYKTMSITELCELPIKDITEDNAVLFLWVTSPLLEDSFSIIKAWDFQYKTSFIWDKVKHNMGHYNSVRHELLLIATKGSCLPDNKKLYDSVQSVERSDIHSEKPEIFRQIIDDLYTYGNRIELFARKQVEGWEGWGLECG